MSDDQLDKEFKNRIKQVFDNYEDDTGAEGWVLLREKFPEKEGDRVVAWLWRYISVAAMLLAVLGAALWFTQKHAGNKNVVVKNNTHTPAPPVKIAAAAKDTSNSNPNNSKTNIAYQSPVKPGNTSHKNARLAAFTPAITKQARSSVNTAVNNLPATTTKNIAAVKPVASNAPEVLNSGNTASAVAVNKPVIQTAPVYPADNSTQNAVAATQQPVITHVLPFAPFDTTKTGKIATTGNTPPANNTTSVTSTKKPDIQSLFANDSKYNTAQNNKSDVTVKNRKVVFGVYAATYVNYAKGSNNQFNTGAGITSDIRLTENLSIVTGVAIAQNSFSYNDISASSPVMFPAALSHSFSASSLALSDVTPPSRNLDASLVGLDVPVDLKYMISPGTSSAYISAGLSSGAFINETYNYTYSYNVDNSPSNQQSQGATDRRSFADFYFAKMLNVSFGVGYPLGKGNQLIIEPFLKYPLTGMGDQHILFGSGGLNLKLNFDAPKGKH